MFWAFSVEGKERGDFPGAERSFWFVFSAGVQGFFPVVIGISRQGHPPKRQPAARQRSAFTLSPVPLALSNPVVA